MVERNCSNCGRALPAGRHFCVGCGRPVGEEPKPAPPEPAVRFCVKCGAAYVAGKRFCKQCGHAVGATVANAAVEPSAVAQGEPAAAKAIVGEASGQAIPVISIPTRLEESALLCSKCGAAIAPGKNFCKQCGQAVSSTKPTTDDEPSVNSMPLCSKSV